MKTSGTAAGGPMAWLAMVGLVIIVAVPFVFIVLQAIFPALGQGSFAEPFHHLMATLADRALLQMSANTILLGAAVVVLSASIAVPLAMCRALFKIPGALVWDALLLVPFMIPPYIATLGWVMTLQPRGYLQQLVGFNLSRLLFSVGGMALVMTFNTFPIVYFAVSRTVEAVGARYADTGRVFGASPVKAFLRITLPLATPGLAGSLLLVFAAAIEEYGTPAVLGRHSGFQVLVTGIDLRVSDWPIDLPGAATLSLILVLLSLAAFLLQRRLLSGRSYVTTSSKPQNKDKRPLGKAAVPVFAAFVLVTCMTTAIPLLAILATALSRTISGGLTFKNLWLGNFIEITNDGADGLRALLNSLALGTTAAMLTGLLGAIAAYTTVTSRFRGRLALDIMTTLPNALPGVVVAVGLILAWNSPGLPFTPYNTPVILLLAYCCILLPQPVRYTTAALMQIGDNLEAAARVCGASSFTAFRRIILPLIAPSLVTSMLLVFAVATRELVATILVAPVGMVTIATFIWRQFEQGSVGLGMAMALMTIVITTLIPLGLIALLRRRGFVAE